VPRRSSTRRTVSKVSCRVSPGDGNGGVLTIDAPRRELRERETEVEMKAVVKVHLKDKTVFESPFLFSRFLGKLVHRQWLFIEFVSTEVDPGKESEGIKTGQVEAKYVSSEDDFCIFEATCRVPSSFTVGAVLIDNDHEHEMFIKDVEVLRDGDKSTAVYLDCESWVIDNEKNGNDDRRVFFPLKSYLPSETPKGLQRLRKSELEAIRGNGRGERVKSDRIYDYDVYNDLGDPSNPRPVLGGSAEFPYPRRCRTGRPKNNRDSTETRVKEASDIYVPRDEAFSESKEQAFKTKATLGVLHAFLELMKTKDKRDLSFPSLAAIDALFEEGFTNAPPPKEGGTVRGYTFSVLKEELGHLFKGEFGAMKHTLDKILDFETPEIRQKDKLAWFRDEEFARETLAGMNPMNIQLVTKLPIESQLDESTYGPRESLLTKELIEDLINGVMTADEAVEKKKLFMLDYHDALLPYVHKVREQEDTTLYGSRTLFFLTKDGTLKPIAIELTRPKYKTGKLPWRDVFTPGGSVTDSWMWQLAKTHVLAHDTGYHQLINHWLRTHCCVEPYIIAAHRQLSEMHPIFRLLHPHFRYTMEINALARGRLINAGGTIETTFSPKKYSMELSSVVYKDFWRFDMEALPNDLIRRGMAVQGKDGKLELTIEDYPYANDGLLIWQAIEEWVSDYVKHYYPTTADIINDEELQGWWTEVRTKGHEDKKDEPWWPEVNSHRSLVQVLTTIIWITSGHHAAVNFGQYPFAGYFPNRPTIARQNIPRETGCQGMSDFVTNPEKVLLDTLPSQFQSLMVLVVLDLLSSHSPEEEYMGTHEEPAWAAEEGIRKAFDKFRGTLRDIWDQIDDWNQDSQRKNRYGPGVVPYTLLRPCDGDPFDEKSIMEMGIPNSISI